MKIGRWIGCILLVLLGAYILGFASQRVPSVQSQRLTQDFSMSVLPLIATFTVQRYDDVSGQLITDMVISVSTATAVLSAQQSTYWLTIPTALEYLGAGRVVAQQLYLVDSSPSPLEVYKVAHDATGYYAVLREPRARNITPVTIFSNVHEDDQVGLIFNITGTDRIIEQRTTYQLNPVTNVFILSGRSFQGFDFQTVDMLSVPEGATGAPVFLWRPDPILHPQTPYILAGLLLDTVGKAELNAPPGTPTEHGAFFVEQAVTLPPLSELLR